ncbi:UNVERIFIED_CONTAM: hypothetical protein K2H54_039677 [Gekko kuhli]
MKMMKASSWGGHCHCTAAALSSTLLLTTSADHPFSIASLSSSTSLLGEPADGRWGREQGGRGARFPRPVTWAAMGFSS